MSDITIRIEGVDKLAKKLSHLTPGIKAGIKAATLHIKGKIAQYPPATAANMPKAYAPGQWNTWYERGWGSKWATAGGGWRGRKTSEALGRKWTIEMKNDGLTGIVGNNATYAPFVQGPDQQAQALKRIGWKTTKDVAEQEKDEVVNFVKRQIDRALQEG